MKVETVITRLDLLRFNVAILPKLKVYYFLVSFLVVAAFFVTVEIDGFPVGAYGWLERTAISFTLALSGFGIMYVFMLFLQIVSARTSRGVIGAHEYILSEEGFRDRTPQTDSFMKWSFIMGVIVTKAFVLVKVSNAGFYIIPRRSFPNEERYGEFALYIQKYLNASA